MGKYMRKPKTTRDVAVMDVSHSSLGVRTRAKTLALQRLQSTPSPPKFDYLELRSRRLEKPPLLRKNPLPKQGFVCTDKDDSHTQIEASPENPSSRSGFPLEPAMEVDRYSARQTGGLEIGNSEIEASLGENYLELEARERCTRESTPCSMIRAADTVTTPGSSTKRRSPSVVNQRVQNVLRNIPTSHEMEEFFTCAEQPQQRRFIEKYNFDIVNDLPLPGRYEWVRVMP